MSTKIQDDIDYIMKNLKNGRTIEFIYAPKNIRGFDESDFIYDPRFDSHYNKFYLEKSGNKLRFRDEDGKIVKIKSPGAKAKKLFYDYYYDPEFSTMVGLVDEYGDNLIFYDSDKGVFYRDDLYY